MSSGVFMIERAMLSKITTCKLLVVFRVFLLLSVCGFDDDSAKSSVCESLGDNSFGEVYKDLEILLGFCTPLVWFMFFETVVLDKVGLVGLDTSFYIYFYFCLFVPCSVSAALLLLINNYFLGLRRDSFPKGKFCDVVLVLLWLDLLRFSLNSCNCFAMLRVGSVKFDPFFDLVVIGDTRWMEVFTLTEILLLGELNQDIIHSDY